MPDPENPRKYVPPALRPMKIIPPPYPHYCAHGCGEKFKTTKKRQQHEKKCKKRGGS